KLIGRVGDRRSEIEDRRLVIGDWTGGLAVWKENRPDFVKGGADGIGAGGGQYRCRVGRGEANDAAASVLAGADAVDRILDDDAGRSRNAKPLRRALIGFGIGLGVLDILSRDHGVKAIVQVEAVERQHLVAAQRR